jgi:5-methylcytosine-specific restriction enzyme subunit McrC
MNVLFEAYVGHYLRKHCSSPVSLQDKGHHLACQNSTGKFALKPDIVIDGGKTIADTKWKLLSEDKSYKGVAQSDVYQMYAYATKYQQCKQIFLIYPATEKTQDMSDSYCFKSVDNHKDVTLSVVFFDLVKDRFNGNAQLSLIGLA